MADTRSQNVAVALVTGCSSGIGRAAAEHLWRSGMRVFATARREESVSELAALARSCGDRFHAARLDVTEASTIEAVVDEISQSCGGVDVLVNNAGYGQVGAAEELSIDAWRRQFETNLFGAIAVTGACLPGMRTRGCGRVINVSSVVAHVALPLMGAYCASKHALEAFSVSLRREVAPFGIQVVLIEPGPIATQFRTHIERDYDDGTVGNHPAYRAAHEAVNRYWNSRVGRQGKTPDEVAAVIARAAQARHPRKRYRITTVAKILPPLKALLPESLWDAVMARRMRG